MASVKEIEAKLKTAFTEDQASVLAEVVYDSYNDLVKISDFNELKEIVKELAGAQKRTEVTVGELVAAQKQTEWELRNLARQVGGLSEAFGGSLEDFAIDLVPELLEKYWGMKIEDAKRDSIAINGGEYDFDLVITGSVGGKKLTVLGEVKSNVTLAETKKFLQLSSKAKDSLKTEVRSIFFGHRAEKKAREYIKKHKAYMVFTHGKVL